jgi:hypothetical protein
MCVLLFLRRVWTWLKKYWKYLLFPVGILLGVLGMLSKRKDLGDVVAPKEVETEGERDQANQEAKELSAEAKAERDEKVMEIGREHLGTVMKLTDEQKVKARELVDDPEQLNEYLLDVGKEIRG